MAYEGNRAAEKLPPAGHAVMALGLYLRARHVGALCMGMLMVGVILFTPLGSYLVPRTGVSVFDLETPLRLYATAFLAAFPCAALGPGALHVERCARASWPLLHLGGGVALVAVGALTLIVGCTVVSVPRAPVLLAFLLLTGLSVVASAFVGPSGWTMAAGYSTLCALLGSRGDWWALLVREPSAVSWLLAGALLVGALACHAAFASHADGDD